MDEAGTGTTGMIADCRQVGLPEPDFEQRGPHFVVTLWWDWLTEDILAELRLNERQLKSVVLVKRAGQIANSEFQQLTDASRKTAARDLDGLVKKKIFIRIGEKRGSHYSVDTRHTM